MNIEAVTNAKQNARKLLAGRIDLWYTDTATVAMFISQLVAEGYKDVRPGDMIPVYTTSTEKEWYAFNGDTPDSIVNAWQTALESLLNDGTVREILRRYNMEHLHPTMKD